MDDDYNDDDDDDNDNNHNHSSSKKLRIGLMGVYPAKAIALQRNTTTYDPWRTPTENSEK